MLCDNIEGWDGAGAMGGRFEKEGIYVRLIHIVVRQKPTQQCKAIILQLKFFFKNGFLLLAIVTFPLHPLLGKMLKVLKHGPDKKAPGPAFTVFLAVQPTMLSEHTCTPAEKVHSHAEAKRPSHMHNILFIAFHIYIHEREWLLIFLPCLSLTWPGIKVMLLSENELGSTLTFFLSSGRKCIRLEL